MIEAKGWAEGEGGKGEEKGRWKEIEREGERDRETDGV